MKYCYKLLLWICLITFSVLNVQGQRKMENLGRGVVATRSASDEAFISWRLLGTEAQNIGFNIYRSTGGGAAVKLNDQVLLKGTNWVDRTADWTVDNNYFVKPVENGIEQAASAVFTLVANTPVQPFFKVPIRNLAGYASQCVFVGDLDGDGEFDYVMDKQPDVSTKSTLLEAYKRDGTFLWEIDLGPNSINRDNIEPGSSAIDIGHADNWTVYDINQDGKAEVILRTANGVKFADGTVLTESDNDKQFISVINGLTGVEISRTPFNNPYIARGPMSSHMGIAYLDGFHPSIVWEAKNRNADGSFNEITTAYEWKTNTLAQLWQYHVPDGLAHQVTGHQIRCVDIDGDGKDEVIPFGFALDDDGRLLYALSDHDIWHGDRFFISDLDPNRPGLEMYGIQQGYSASGIEWYYCDARTGEVIHDQHAPGDGDLGRGYAGDLDPRYDGYEFYTFVDGLYNVSGEKTSTALPGSYPNLRLWWDGDLGSENLDKSKFTKWNYLTDREDRLYTAKSVINLPRNVPAFYGDIMGDWREEVIYESSDHNSLTIFTTPYPTDVRLYTLAQNPAYRNDMARKGYQQSLMVDYYLGYNMKQPPIPPIQTADVYWSGRQGAVWNKSANNWITDADQAATFKDGDKVMLDIRGSNADTIELTENVSPARLWLMNPAGKNYVISGPGKLRGKMDLIKALDGKVTLSGNHDFTGATSIEEGVLNINGQYNSPIMVKAKGQLGGTGMLNALVTMDEGLNSAGGTIDPGNGPAADELGALMLKNSLVLPGNNNLTFDIIPGSAKVNDSLIIKGDLKAAGVNTIKVNFKNNITVPGTYTLIRVTGALNLTKANFKLEGAFGASKDILIEGKQVKLVVFAQRAPATVAWTGTEDNVWDFETNNFDLNGGSTGFVSNDSVLFGVEARNKAITLNENIYTAGLTFNDGNYTVSGNGVIAGVGGITKYGDTSSVSILMNKNTFTGKTIIHGGKFVISNLELAGKPSSLGAAAADPSNIVLDQSLLTILQDSYSDRGITLIGTDTLNIPENKATILTGNVIGTGSFAKVGAGSIYMIGKKSLTGPVDIVEGTVNLRQKEGNEGGLGTGPVTIENAQINLQDVRNYAEIGWDIIVPAGKTATINADGRSTMLGKLTGAGVLNFKTPYVRTDLKGDWSGFTGIIKISGSDFRIANQKGYGNATLNLTEGTMYTMSGSSNKATIGALNGVVGTSVNTGNWTIGAKGTDAVFNGMISGNSIIKVGEGSWTLTGANTYKGGTTVQAGKLIVNNAAGSGTGTGDVQVASDAVLGGTGIINGGILLNSGAILAPGDAAIGTLTANATVDMKAGAITEMEVNKSSLSSDRLSVAGSLTLGGVLKILTLGGDDFAPGDQFQLFDAMTIQGGFSTIEPATPGAGLVWDFSSSTGILKVISDPDGVFNLTADNFRISASDETCISSNNGQIRINAIAPFDYTATLNGDNKKSYDFKSSSPLEITNLSAGKYKVCITVKGHEKFEQNFDLVIAEPQPLSVYSSIDTDDKLVTLSLKGGSLYRVTLNGETISTTLGKVTLALSQGSNKLTVNTGKECQGVFEKSILLGKAKTVFPNPFTNIINVNMGGEHIAEANVSIFKMDGARVYANKLPVHGGKLSVDLSALSTGNYLLKVKSKLSETTYKIIKK